MLMELCVLMFALCLRIVRASRSLLRRLQCVRLR
jgi:hypothetical protein